MLTRTAQSKPPNASFSGASPRRSANGHLAAPFAPANVGRGDFGARGVHMCVRRSLFVVSFILLGLAPAFAFDPATDHTCVAYCGGDPPPRSGGYVAPVPRGPSPAEIARRKARAAGVAANRRGAAAMNRKLAGGDVSSRVSEMLRNYKEAVRDFEEAARYLPNDGTIQLNLANARGTVAQFEGRYADAVRYFEEALRYSPHNSIVRENLKRARTTLASSKNPDQVSRDDVLKAAQAAEKAQDWDVAVKYRQRAYELCMSSGRNDCDIDSAFVKYAVGRQEIANKSLDAGIKNLHEVLDFYDKKFGSAASGFGSLKEWKIEITTALQIAEAQRRQEQATNPNYPQPPPVYRDATTPRSYPDLGYYTKEQHDAHKSNEMGNVWAKTGNWEQALVNYQQALSEDPEGPFAAVIKENLDLAMKHLKEDQAKRAGSQPQAASPPITAQKAAEPPPKEVVESNCTGWMTANGVSSRLCMDAQAHRYCEQSAQADGKGVISRVACQ